MNKKLIHILILSGAALSVTACEKTKEQFDFSKKAPDEFAVVRRAPLEMPPEFSLPAPQPGAQRPQEKATTELAREAVLGESAAPQEQADTGTSEGENILLQKTGAAAASSDIRQKVDEETAKIAEDKMPGIDKLKKLVGKDVEPAAKVVDPVAEAARLKKLKEQGKPVTQGETPTKSE